jgi:hypothetical protein
MTPRTRLGLGVAGAGIVLGLAGDVLLRATPWGLNLALWASALALAAAAVVRRLGDGFRRNLLLLPVAAAFAGVAVWRASPVLLTLDVAAGLLALAVAGLPPARWTRGGRHLREYGRAVLRVGEQAGAGAVFAVAADIEWESLPRWRWTREAIAVGRGAALAAPLLVVFGALFVAADAAFSNLVEDAFDDERAAGHVFLFTVFAWVGAGLVRSVAISRSEALVWRPRRLSLGATEITVALALVDALFAAFVAVQFRYLFGGAGHVEATTGLTYSEYARRGFFELVAATGLVLPLLLAADRLIRPRRRRELRLFRALGALLVLLVLVVMASAVQRMRLYQDAYGLTALRVYATAFMLWLAIVLAWLLVTVLRGRRGRFAVGALAAVFAAVFALDVANPDALIARTNTARGLEGKPLDVRYLGTLSPDATPVLARELPRLARTRPADRDALAALAAQLIARTSEANDWRSWSWSRRQAGLAVKTPALRALASG